MKKLYFVFAIAAFITACSGGKTGKTENAEFTLNGKFADSNFDGKDIYLLKFDDKSDNYLPVDTAKVENGTFTFRETINGESDMRFISTFGFPKSVFVIAEQGVIEMALDSTLTATLKGGVLNNKYQEYMNNRNSFSDKMLDVKKLADQDKLTPEYEKELEAKYDSLYDGLRAYIFETAKENISNTVGQYILIDRSMSFDKTQLGELFSAIDPIKVKQEVRFNKANKRFETLKAIETGNMFRDIKANTPDGKPISLSEYAGKGKYVLVDFWASWCPPCRKDMPEVVALYNTYKGKNFEIVGVSLDSDNEAWIKGIKNLNITWPQMSDLKGWQSVPAATYGVNSIPRMILFDKEGKIINNQISIPELSEKLKDLLK